MTTVEPEGKDEIDSTAFPPLVATVPRTVFPAENVTEPVGATAVAGLIFAVNVTD